MLNGLKIVTGNFEKWHKDSPMLLDNIYEDLGDETLSIVSGSLSGVGMVKLKCFCVPE